MSFETAIVPLLDCMCTALGEVGWEGECCVEPGLPVFDNCCEEGGMAWARLVRAYPSTVFPQEDLSVALSDCQVSQWALAVELGAVRCVCPTCDCSTKAPQASSTLAEAEAALRGIGCCFANGPCRDVEYKVVELSTVGPEAACGGFKIQLLRQYHTNCCPPEDV